jgi:pimeloyl-ACP methyl ester carboxylesterase
VRARRVLPLVVTAVLAAGCSSGAADVTVSGTGSAQTTTPTTEASAPSTSGSAPTTVPTDGTTVVPSATLTWTPCGSGLECTTLPVPLDPAEPAKGTVALYLKRRPAGQPTERIGSLLVNPGGPGVPGTLLVDNAAAAFSPDLLDHFDIVAWDPRGTGRSRPVDCVEDLDPLFAPDPSPDTPAEKQALITEAKSFDQACEVHSGAILPYISTQETARDMDRIRVALGEDKISYFGFSYGSQLGATYATLFPSHVRAMVIDGASDPTASYEDNAKQQAIGLERGLTALLDDCAKKTSCAFHHDGKPEAAYDALFARLDAHPLPVGGGRPAVGQGIATYAVLSGLYDQSYWPIVTDALAAAEKGDGRPLLDLYDAYVERQPDGTFSNAFEALIAINCLDDPGPIDPSFPDRIAPVLEKISPHFGAWAAYSYNCIYWPAKAVPKLTITGKGAGPIVVVGTTGDPVTPIESTRHMAQALEGGRLVTVQADRHTGYGVNRCVVDAVDNYLTDGTVPRAGLTCT